ncbi:hypothetical protein BDR26DRAFT_929433 [Obelidium mucronatum]|nr:hypothetical protein BDR26DRAFT_929433 [Obelidium mucronatum]
MISATFWKSVILYVALWPFVSALPPATALLRGLYIAPYEANTKSNFNFILTNQTSRSYLLDFIAQKNINSISIYDLHKILPDAALSTNLLDFIQTARSRGVIEVNAVGGILDDFDRINTFNEKNGRPFNGAITEVEFWNAKPENLILGQNNVEAAFNAYISLLGAINNLKSGLKLTSYLGWLDKDTTNQTVVDERALKIARNLQRVYLHCYDKTPDLAWERRAVDRISKFSKAENLLEFQPIFSAEGNDYYDDVIAHGFMGDWIRNNSIGAAEESFLQNYLKDPSATNSSQLKMVGFQYFDYKYLAFHVPLVTAPTTTITATTNKPTTTTSTAATTTTTTTSATATTAITTTSTTATTTTTKPTTTTATTTTTTTTTKPATTAATTTTTTTTKPTTTTPTTATTTTTTTKPATTTATTTTTTTTTKPTTTTATTTTITTTTKPSTAAGTTTTTTTNKPTPTVLTGQPCTTYTSSVCSAGVTYYCTGSGPYVWAVWHTGC